jgi:peptide/nickel transport system permease protein
MLNAIIISFTIGISIGAIMAYREGSLFDSATTLFSITSNSIPYYILGILLVFVLGYQMELFPITGRYNGTKVTPGINLPFLQNVLYHVTLPMLSWAFAGFGGWALAMRGNSIRVLGEDYLRVGRLRGLPTHRLTLQYVARNAILPLYTNILIVLGGAFGGSVVLEQIFVYRGMGYFLFRAVESNDYPLLMGGFILIVTSVIFALLFAELTYGILDPRAQDGGAGNESY